MNHKGVVIWFCGLPGSGKSTISKLVKKKLSDELGLEFEYVSMDAIRKKIFPDPKYDDTERDSAYRSLVLIAIFLARNGINVILDGTAHKLVWREFARKECEKFIEVYLRCPIEVSVERETNRVGQGDVRSKLYYDALERLRTGKRISGLGIVPGVDEPFEESKKPEIVVDTYKNSPEQAASIIVKKLRSLLTH